MKYLITFLLSLSLLSPALAATKQKVCVDVRQKSGKVIKECKMMKIHKKPAKTTKVPTKKTAKKTISKSPGSSGR